MGRFRRLLIKKPQRIVRVHDLFRVQGPILYASSLGRMLPLTALFAKTRDAGGGLSPHLCALRLAGLPIREIHDLLGYFRNVGLRT